MQSTHVLVRTEGVEIFEVSGRFCSEEVHFGEGTPCPVPCYSHGIMVSSAASYIRRLILQPIRDLLEGRATSIFHASFLLKPYSRHSLRTRQAQYRSAFASSSNVPVLAR